MGHVEMEASAFHVRTRAERWWDGAPPDTATFVGECLCSGIVIETLAGDVYDWPRPFGELHRRRHECASHLAKQLARVIAERQAIDDAPASQPGPPPATATSRATPEPNVAVAASRSRSGFTL